MPAWGDETDTNDAVVLTQPSRRAGQWIIGAAATFALAALLIYFDALIRGTPFQPDEHCRQEYGESFNDSLDFDRQRFFPLSLRCNENLDMVPTWVNPAVVTLSTASLAALVVGLIVLRRHSGAVRPSA